MASSSIPSNDRELMPGSFGPEDYIDFYPNPYENLDDVQKIWEEREKPSSSSQSNLPDVNVGHVAWQKYNPPASLRKAPNVTSQVLLDIVQSSIENVRNRAAEEARSEQERAENEAAEQAERRKDKEPYLPIIIPSDVNEPVDAASGSEVESRPSTQSVSETIWFSSSRVASFHKPEKQRKFALRRLFNRVKTKSDSSAAGAAREAAEKLARDDISTKSSQEISSFFRRANKLRSSTPQELVECVSCLDDFRPKEIISVTCHGYCQDCFVRLVSTSVQNEQQWPPKCCLNDIPFRVIFKSIPRELQETFRSRSIEWEIPVNERIYCSKARCSLWVSPNQVGHAMQQAQCPQDHLTCTICRGPTHAGSDCPQDFDICLTNKLAEEEGWKRCTNCHALVEHGEACQHMTCRCGHEFCYVCGLVWRTCGCTMEQLEDIKTQAQTRREERDFKEQTDAAELRQILLQIEEFEREEALKAELLRQEQERAEEGQRQRDLEERIRIESIRRRDVEFKYQELRAALDQLHELQQVLLEMDQESEAAETITKNQTTRDELAKKQDAQRLELCTLTSTQLSEKETALEKEFQIRAAIEYEIEEQYHQQLESYWRDKKDGEMEMEAAMFALWKRMDQGLFAWQRWKQNTLDAYRAKLDDKKLVAEEFMYSLKYRTEDACVEDEAEMVRRMAAEKKWMHEVFVERERLMDEWEVLEVEGDADSLFGVDLMTGGVEVEASL